MANTSIAMNFMGKEKWRDQWASLNPVKWKLITHCGFNLA